MINPMKNGSPTFGGLSAPYRSSHSSGPSNWDPPARSAPIRPLPFQDRPGPAYTTHKFCKECSAALDDKWKNCPMCSTPVENPVKLSSLKPNKCDCGRRIGDDFRFCPTCSKPVDEMWKEKPVCKCGVVYMKDAKHCVGCGTKITCTSHEALQGHVAGGRNRRQTRQ